MFACASMACADPPTPRVELWHGTQQVGTFPPQPVEETCPVAEQAPCAQGPALPVPSLLDPALPATQLPRAEKPGLVPTPPDHLLSTQFVAPESAPAVMPAAEGQQKPAPGCVKEGAVQPPAAAEAGTEQPESVSVPGGAPNPSAGEARARGASSDLVFQVACVFGAAFLGPLMSVAMLLWLLRRHGKRSGALFRIEHVGGSASPSLEAMSILAAREALLTSPGWGGRLSEREAAPVPRQAAQPTSAEAFQFGPTCEEEQQHRAAQAQDQEQALLQHFFEDNLRLQEQIERSRNADQ
jgi:hypothetical protein